MSTKPLFDTKTNTDRELVLSEEQKVLALKHKIDEYEEKHNKLTEELRVAKAELKTIPADATGRRDEFEGKVWVLQRELNQCDLDLEMAKTEFNRNGYVVLEMSSTSRKFNKSLCIKNIRYLLSKSNVRLGDIERASGNSPGYLSRLEKPDNTTDLSIEFLLNASDMLGVGLDELVKEKMEEVSPNEEMVAAFLARLIKNTKADELYWTPELGATHNLYEKMGPDEQQPHILYRLFMEEDEATGTAMPTGWSYASRFFPQDGVTVCGTSFHAKITGKEDEIYIMKCKAHVNASDRVETFFEMYHIDVCKSVNPVCCSRYSKDKISEELENLYKQILESNGRVRLTSSTKAMMEQFLK